MNGGFGFVSGLAALFAATTIDNKNRKKQTKKLATYYQKRGKGKNIRMEYNLACDYFEKINKRYEELCKERNEYLITHKKWSDPDVRAKSYEYASAIVSECGGCNLPERMNKAVELAKADMESMGYMSCLFKGVDVSSGKDYEPQINRLEEMFKYS